jgi:AcrR family transcriptional regulator
MAKRQARVAPPSGDGVSQRQQDHSSDLWDPQRSDVVRNLLTSAVRCFAAHGYHATTTRDISIGVGLSPAALYVHFPSKELVLFEIIRTGHERALAYIQELAAASDDPDTDSSVDRLRRMISRYTAWHARHHVAARVCQYELAALTPEHYAQVTALRHQTNEVFRQAVARGVRDGSFADIDVNRVVRAMLSLSIDLVRWYRLDGDDGPDQIGELYADLALAMVSAPPDPPAKRAAKPGRRTATGGKRSSAR